MKIKPLVFDREKRQEGYFQIRDYTLRTTKKFLTKVANEFCPPLTAEELFFRFKGLFVSEKHFLRHIAKHALPPYYVQKVFGLPPGQYPDWTTLKRELPREDLIKFSQTYFKSFLEALAHITRNFYRLDFEGANPSVTLWSEHKKWFVVHLFGDKLLTAHKLQGYSSLDEWRDRYKSLASEGKLLIFEEVDIDEEIRLLSWKIRSYLEGY